MIYFAGNESIHIHTRGGYSRYIRKIRNRMNLIIHRGADQIGGCITEISTENCKILIDFGSNLPGCKKRKN